MVKPSSKASAIEEILDSISGEMFGHKRSTSIEGNTCVVCGKPAKEFKDELSRKEYSISGMCQDCQDATFTEY